MTSEQTFAIVGLIASALCAAWLFVAAQIGVHPLARTGSRASRVAALVGLLVAVAGVVYFAGVLGERL